MRKSECAYAARARVCCGCGWSVSFTYCFARRATGDAAFFGCFSASRARCPRTDWSSRFRLMRGVSSGKGRVKGLRLAARIDRAGVLAQARLAEDRPVAEPAQQPVRLHERQSRPDDPP